MQYHWEQQRTMSEGLTDNLSLQVTDHVGSVNVVRLTQDGNYCMTGSDDRSIKLWNPFKEDPVKPGSPLLIKTYFGAHGYSVLDISISVDKAKFASCGEDKNFFLWDVANARTIRRFQGHVAKVNAIELNTDATVIFTASYDQTVCCWDLRSNSFEPIQVMRDFKDSVSSIARSEFCILASSIDGNVRVYDIRKGCMHTDRLVDPITNIRLSEDQNTYLATCLGGVVRLVDFTTGNILKEYRGHTHSSFKAESCYDSDHFHIVAGSEDGSIAHWNLTTADVAYRTAAAHSRGIASLCYHPSKPIFLTAGYDGKMKIWDNSARIQT